jgi:taurine-pyruvate aminotransferase
MKNATTSATSYVDLDKKYVWHHLAQHKVFEAHPPMIVVEGKGLRIKDINGKEYLDATSGGVWCVNVGYGRDRIADAVAAQLKTMPYYAASAGNLPSIELSRRLVALMPGLSRVFISSSGSEANEKAYKMVRAIAHLQGTPEKKKIFYRNRDYHGTTLGTLSSAGQSERKEWFGPFLEGFVEFPHACCYRCPFSKTYPGCDLECAKVVEKIIQKENPETVGGLIVEPITAGGGIIVPVKEYYGELAAICRKYGVILILDEVVCGMGRTGTMFGYQHWGITPDMVTLAKGVASAYAAISATVTTEAVFKAFLHDPSNKLAYFRDISTYGGCTGSSSAAIENLKIIDEEHLLENVKTMGAYLLDSLKDLLSLPNVGEVRGRGLLCGVELVSDKTTKVPLPEETVVRIVGEMATRGVIVGRINRSCPGFNNIINMAPAFVVTKSDIDAIVGTMRAAIEKVCAV